MALERVRVARGDREIGAVVRRELRKGLGVATVRVLRPAGGNSLADASGGASPLERTSPILAVLRESNGPIDFSDRSIRALLPSSDREWLDVNGVALAVALKERDGAVSVVIAVGPKRDDRAFERKDRWFVAAL